MALSTWFLDHIPLYLFPCHYWNHRVSGYFVRRFSLKLCLFTTSLFGRLKNAWSPVRDGPVLWHGISLPPVTLLISWYNVLLATTSPTMCRGVSSKISSKLTVGNVVWELIMHTHYLFIVFYRLLNFLRCHYLNRGNKVIRLQ